MHTLHLPNQLTSRMTTHTEQIASLGGHADDNRRRIVSLFSLRLLVIPKSAWPALSLFRSSAQHRASRVC